MTVGQGAMKRFQDDFTDLLNGFNLDTLENDPNSIYGLSKQLTSNYLNPGWFDFARENEGEPSAGRSCVGSVDLRVGSQASDPETVILITPTDL